jgi:hypothetical protein
MAIAVVRKPISKSGERPEDAKARSEFRDN